MTEEKHYFRLKDRKFYGICNLNKEISKENITNDFFLITCSKCKSMLVKESLKAEYNKGKLQAQKDILEIIEYELNEEKQAIRIEREWTIVKELELVKRKIQAQNQSPNKSESELSNSNTTQQVQTGSDNIQNKQEGKEC